MQARLLSRRRFCRTALGLTGLGLLSGCGLPPRQWQPAPKIPTLGILLFGTPAADPNLNALLQGLGELGYRDGETITIEYRYAEGRSERLPDLAAELVRLQPDIVFALGGDVASAAKQATSTIPVVTATSSDPVQGGLIASLARPGANVTGVTFLSSELASKRLQLLKEILPGMSRVAILWNPEHADPDFQETQVAAATLGVRLDSRPVRGFSDLDGAFEAIVSGRVEGLIIVPSRLTSLARQRILEFAANQRLPNVSGWSVFARGGGLLSYGPNLDIAIRRAASYVDKILKGTKPADLPVEQPTEFELVINLKTAQALGLTIPHSILQQATELIQ